MALLFWLCMGAGTYAALRRYTRPTPITHASIAKIQREHNEAVTALSKQINQHIENTTIARSLESKILADALLREARAKAAVVAVLKLEGASEEQILTVMRDIDEAEEGDL